MNDEKFVAQQTERERKSLAAAARKRKTHNGKGGCTLNYERLTRKELEAMNGEISTYDLKKPMRWKEFQALPTDLQETYIYQLVRKYDISMASFSKMLGVSQVTVCRWGKEHPKLASIFNSSTSSSSERLKKKKEFLMWAGVGVAEKVEVEESEESKQSEHSEDIPQERLYSQDELEMALLRQKVKIYEQIIFRGGIDAHY